MESKQFFLEIEQMRRPLESWRRTRKHRDRIPESLWTAMGRLARTYGISPVSQALGVDYYGLKRRVMETQETSSAAPLRPAFVELKALTSGRAAGCTLEWEDRSGGKMILRVDQSQGVDLLALAQAFWRRGG